MKKLAVLFSHGQLTDGQRLDAESSLGVKSDGILYLPEDLQTVFSNIPPDLESIGTWIAPIKMWVQEQLQAGDFALVQGDFGLVVSLVEYCRQLGIIPIYSTTLRQVSMERETGAKTSIFKHVRYRFY